ncbi:MAG TPA: IclR family transcriptional regulator C-terminal domain-containing protein [Acidimicrobiia bacterium]|nr:IclR family transcriptional regulator C-terminal domain-containing protein [Acidimicrobiia bacterium]
MTDVRSGDFIQSLERGLAVINTFSREHPAPTLSEMAQMTGLTRATARRVLLTLVELGYVEQDGRTFSLTPRVLDLGYSYLSSFHILELAQGPMERLVEQVRESSSMSILDGSDVVYVARVPTKRIMTISLALGSRLPAYPTSMGRVLLAGLSDSEIDEYIARTDLVKLTENTVTDSVRFRAILMKVRAQGHALVDQELEEGVRSLAAPILDARGHVMAAMNVSCHATRATVARMREEFLPRLLATAAEVSDRASALRVG